MKHLIGMPARKRIQLGFTLVELMVAVAIVTILAAVGYPSYIQYTVRSNRSAAQSFMSSIANKQEQYMLDARAYATTLAILGMSAPAEVSRNYDITMAVDNTATPPSYTITATRINSQLTSDTKCGNLTLDQTGLKGTSVLPSPVAGCW